MLLLALQTELSSKRHRTPKIDEGLFPRIAEGDMEAFHELYVAAEPALHAYLLSLTCDPQLACDLVHDSFIKVRASAKQYKPQGKPLAWLFTIAKSLSASHFRKAGRSYSTDFSAPMPQLSVVEDPTDRLVLEAALTRLAEDEREIVLLHVVSGVLHREIAKALNMPLSTVLSKYRRALIKMKQFIREEERS